MTLFDAPRVKLPEPPREWTDEVKRACDEKCEAVGDRPCHEWTDLRERGPCRRCARRGAGPRKLPMKVSE